MIDYSTLPEHLRDGMRRYIENGIPTGEFLKAVLSNDLMRAVGKADDVSRAFMVDICRWLHWEAPAECYGSPKKVAAWIAQGGLERVAA